MTDQNHDPFGEKSIRPFRRRVNVLGANCECTSNDARLIEILDQAFSELPRHELGSPPVDLNIALVLVGSASSSPAGWQQPHYQSGAGLIVATVDAGNFAAISVSQRSSLICVTSDMLLSYPYEVRYELVEFALLTLASRVQDLVPLHAASIGINGYGLLLNGPSGSGKSLLSLACTLRGFDFLAEDAVFVSAEKGVATACPGFLHLHEGSLAHVSSSGVAHIIRSSPVIQRQGGARKYEVDLRRSGFSLADRPLRIVVLVMLSNPGDAAESLLARVSVGELMEELERDQGYAAQLRSWQAFRTMIAELPAYRLAYRPDPDAAANAFRELIRIHAP